MEKGRAPAGAGKDARDRAADASAGSSVASGHDVAPGTLLAHLAVTDLTLEGGGVARHEGRVVFLDRGIPGDVVTARVTGLRKGVLEAEVDAVEEPSPHGVLPWCEAFGMCGGCQLQHMSPEEARRWKRRRVAETLARLGGAGRIPVEETLYAASDRRGRIKTTLAFGGDGAGGTLLGMRRRGGKEVIPIRDCGIHVRPLAGLLDRLREGVAALGLRAWEGGTHPGGLRFCIVHSPIHTPPDGVPKTLLEIVTGPARGRSGAAVEGRVRELAEGLKADLGLAGVVHTRRGDAADVARGESTALVLGQDWYEERAGDIVLSVPHDAFLQTDTAAAGTLLALVLREAGLAGSETVWDAYCGVGAIGLSLASKASRVLGFERQAGAVAAARRNAETLGLSGCTFLQGDVARLLGKCLAGRDASPDLLVLDPPRAGIGRDVAQLVRRTPAGRILYISCDVGTQARDVAWLAPVWRPVKAVPVDMFPYACHVESLVVLERGG
jgi:23S rRNA (uracil1939-C5)-methyltransferase